MKDTKLCDYVEENETPHFIKESEIGDEKIDLFLLDLFRQKNYFSITAKDINSATTQFDEANIKERLSVFKNHGIIESTPEGYKANNNHTLMESFRNWFKTEFIQLD